MAHLSQSRGERIAAWMVVLAVHAGLLWILVLVPDGADTGRSDAQGIRLRLVAPGRAPPPLLHTSSVRPDARSMRADTTTLPPDRRATVPAPGPDMTPARSAARGAPVDWEERARHWVRAQDTGPAAGAADPLRIGAGTSLADVRAEAFRISEPVTVQGVLVGIGQLFGGTPPSPCETATRNIPGLLTASSDRERELLHEELRRQRRHCSR